MRSTTRKATLILAIIALLLVSMAPASASPAYTVDAYSHFNTTSVTVAVGQPFTLDLYTNGGSNAVIAQQSYLLFPASQLQVTVGGSCTPLESLQPDYSTFSTVLQNDVCNGPNPCTNWRGQTYPSGSIGFASGKFGGPIGGDFRVASVPMCATQAGTAVLHWQFSPPYAPNRDSRVVDANGVTVSSSALYQDVTVIVLGDTPTPTVTPTATNTPTATDTPTASPPTPTATPCHTRRCVQP